MKIRIKKFEEVDQNIEDLVVNINNAMTWNPPYPTSTNYNNTPEVETVDESDAKADKDENEEAIQDEGGIEF